MKALITFFLAFLVAINAAYAKDPRIVEYNKDNNTVKIELDGKEYDLQIPDNIEETYNEPIDEIATEEESIDLAGEATKKRKRYAKGPAASNVGARLYNIPTDNLLPKGGIGFDFTHRFSGSIDDNTANDVFGLDTFSFSGLGLYYGLLNNLELHAFRTSLNDASEFGLKYQIFKESATKGEGLPFGLTLSSGFQLDNIQNRFDFFIQPILSKVLIPHWFKVYLAPTWADRTGTIATANSKSAIFFTFTDPKGRSPQIEQGTFALPIGATLQVIPDRMSVFGEYAPRLAGYREVANAWAFGLQILSRLETHVWTIGISNTPYSTFGQFIVGGPSNKLHFGFNITARVK